MGDRNRGLYRNEEGNPGKYDVRRTDGRDAEGEKHHGCSYFVLDLTHDLHGRRAALAYANSARADGYVKLADELAELVENLGGVRDVGRYEGGDLGRFRRDGDG
jgi:hypothetical protein